MAFASKKVGSLALLLLAGSVALCAQTVRFEVRHDHWRKGCHGILTADSQGIAFHGEKNHNWSWKYEDIQELKLAAGHIHLLSYWDNLWRLGADRGYDFSGKIPEKKLYALWKDKLDQRFVAELADPRMRPLWEIPVKHLGRIRGSEGMLEIGGDRIVYVSHKGDARTWRFEDIDNLSSAGPFELTLTTFERARLHYADRRQFHFELKQVLSQARYDELWRKINERNGSIR